MRISKEGLMAIAGHEGIVTAPYRDSVGVWTIGIGHTAAAGPPDPAAFEGDMTVGEALDLFRDDVARYEREVGEAVDVPLAQHEFDALVSFHYNTGAIARATLTKTLNGGDKAKAGRQFMNWTKPPEIKRRREAEMRLFLDGTYPPPFANIYPAENGKVQWSAARRVDLRDMLDAPAPAPAEPSAPDQPTPPGDTAPGGTGKAPASGALAAAVLAALAAAGAWLSNAPCNLFGILCGS